MLEVTDLAAKNIKSYLNQHNINLSIRVALMQGG